MHSAERLTSGMHSASLSGYRLAASSKFGGFKPESERTIRKAEVETNPVIDEMKDIWKKFSYKRSKETMRSQLSSRLDGLEFSAGDVELFSIVLAEFQDEPGFPKKAGGFLNALMDNCKDREFILHTAHLSSTIPFIGADNEKNITVDGNVGARVGYMMKGGSIIVKGNASVYAGYGMEEGSIIVDNAHGNVGSSMKGGTLTVKGNATDSAGYAMLGGSLIIKGNAGDNVGEFFRGGSILVKGNAGDWIGKKMQGGKISINGKAGHFIGCEMDGGEIHIGGSIGTISSALKDGKIFFKKKLIIDGHNIYYPF